VSSSLFFFQASPFSIDTEEEEEEEEEEETSCSSAKRTRQ
jgi:hypothetical protein